MDPNLEPNKPLAREIVRRIMDAWRLKRAYKYRSEKRVTHRKLYLSLMKQLMHEIGQRNLHDIIMQRIDFFNHNFLTSLKMEQFEDLMSDCKTPKQETGEKVLIVEVNEVDRKSDQKTASAGTRLNAKQPIGSEVKSTDALRNLQFYQYDPEQDNKEIMSNIKEIEKEDNELTGDLMNETDPQGVDSRSEIKVKTENAFKSQVKVDETLLQEEKNVVKADIRSLFPENEVLKKELEPLLGYRDEKDVYDRIVAADIRGKKFKVSNDGRCPRCHYRKNVFVVLDFLFPMGDMPEICSYLIAKGQAVLWSSQDDSNCKDPPTILCRGKCPADPARCGFNLNWNRTDLESMLFFPEDKNQPKGPLKQNEQPEEVMEDHKSANADSHSLVLNDKAFTSDEKLSSEKKEDDEFNEGQIDMKHYKSIVSWVVLDECADEESQDIEEENQLIKTMLALSNAKQDWEKGLAKLWSDDSDLDEERMDVSDQVYDLSFQTNQPTKESYAFSWNSYGSNPWAPVEFTKKKTQSPESKLVMMATGRTRVPQLLNPLAADELDEQNKMLIFQKQTSDETIEGSIDETVLTATDNPAVPGTDKSDNLVDFCNTKDEASAEDEKSSQSKKKHYTAEDYPVSKDGTCPYCKSADVVYIVISFKEEDDSNEDLPDILKKLLDYNFAYKLPRDENEPPSFQCRSCTYGFNLDWGSSNLETIFGEKLEKAESETIDENEASSARSSINQENTTYHASGYGYQMLANTGYHAVYYPPPFMGFYTPMGFPSIPYAPFYPPPMPPYLPSPPGCIGYRSHTSNPNYLHPDGHNQGQRKQTKSAGRKVSRSSTRANDEPRQSSGQPEKGMIMPDSSLKMRKKAITMEGVTMINENIVKDRNKVIESEDAEEGKKDAKNEPKALTSSGTDTAVVSEPDSYDQPNESSDSLDETENKKTVESECNNKIKAQPPVPLVNANEAEVTELYEENAEHVNQSTNTTAYYELSEDIAQAEEISQPIPPGVTTPVSTRYDSAPIPDAPVLHTIIDQDQVKEAVSSMESDPNNTTQFEAINDLEATENKKSKLEEPGAGEDKDRATALDDKDTDTTPKITTRNRGRGRGPGRGKSKAK